MQAMFLARVFSAGRKNHPIYVIRLAGTPCTQNILARCRYICYTIRNIHFSFYGQFL